MLFDRSDLQHETQDELENRKCLRLLFEANATRDQAATARAYLLNLTQFYGGLDPNDTAIVSHRREGMRELMAGIIRMTEFSVDVLEANAMTEQKIPFEDNA